MTKRNRTPKADNEFSYTKADGSTSREIGVPGIAISMGKVKEDTIAIMQGSKKLKLLEEMVKYDPLIGAFNSMLQSQVTAVEWETKPANDTKKAQKVNDFISSVLFQDLSAGSFDEFILDAMTKSCYGFSIIEPVFKKRNGYKKDVIESSKFNDGKIGISKFASRYQGSISEWIFKDNHRAIDYIKQKDPNTFNEVNIPYDRILHFKHNSTHGNPQGQSIYTNCAVPYDRKKKTAQSEDQRYDKGFAGIYEITLPSAVLDPNTSNSQYRDIQNWAKTVGANISTGRSQAIIKPEFVQTDIKSSNNDGIDANTIIERCNREIAVALLSDFFLITQKSGNSGALGQSKIKVFKTLLNSMLDEIANEINLKLIPMLMERNSLDRELTPTIKHTEIEDLDLTNLMLFIQSAGKTNLIIPDLPTINYLKQKVMGKDVPLTTEKDYKLGMLRAETITADSLDKPNSETLDEYKEQIT